MGIDKIYGKIQGQIQMALMKAQIHRFSLTFRWKTSKKSHFEDCSWDFSSG